MYKDNAQTDNGRLLISSYEQLKKNYCYDSTVQEVVFLVGEGNEVVSVHEEMFFSCDNLTKVTFYNPVDQIGTSAFAQCRLDSVIFHKTVKQINENAFYNNPLTSIAFNNDVIIKDSAFDDCGNASVTLTFTIKDSFTNLIKYAAENHIGCYISREKKITSETKNSSEKNYVGSISEYPLKISVRDFCVFAGREKRDFLRLKKRKKILSDVNLDIYPGEMIMVIGGSGTGKTTLIKNLFGLEVGKDTITISLNDKTVHGKASSGKIKKLLKNQVFYAPQFTISNEYLTVEEEIQKNAKMFSGEYFSAGKLKEVAEKRGLWDEDKKLLTTLVKQISGGQKKKLMMACSQITNPQILVFDEPDSGLDEPSAFHLFIHDLRKQEVDEKGKTVLIVSHHPHNFMNLFAKGNERIPFEKIFNKIIVLAKKSNVEGGTIAFCGTPSDARAFFGLKSNDPYSRIISLVMREIEGGESDESTIQNYIRKYQKMYR